MTSRVTRIIIDCILVLLAFIVPWWLTMLLAAIACFYFPWYFEIVLIGLIIDSLYNAPVRDFGHIQFASAFLGLIILIVAEEVRRRTRFGTR